MFFISLVSNSTLSEPQRHNAPWLHQTKPLEGASLSFIIQRPLKPQRIEIPVALLRLYEDRFPGLHTINAEMLLLCAGAEDRERNECFPIDDSCSKRRNLNERDIEAEPHRLTMFYSLPLNGGSSAMNRRKKEKGNKHSETRAEIKKGFPWRDCLLTYRTM